MKNKNFLLLIALISLSSCGQTSSLVPTTSTNQPDDLEIVKTPYSNEVKYSKVSNPSKDIDI